MRFPATLICLFLILYLFWNDFKNNDSSSKALWIPFFWMFLAGSRYVSGWLNIGSPSGPTTSYNDGSPVDALTFALLIAAGIYVLSKRKIDWGGVLSQNKLIWMYFLYCGISIAWSDDSFICFKRFLKELGNPIMALVFLTEEAPYQAVGVVLRRLAFLLLPLSVLFVRYYPDLGRTFHVDGSPMYTGVGNQKNDLGSMCLITGIYFSWDYLLCRSDRFRRRWKTGIFDLAFMGIIAYLLRLSNSATSFVCLLIAICLFFIGRMKSIVRKPDRILVLIISVVLIFFVLDATLNLKGFLLSILGRDENLTDRVPAWQILGQMATNPVLGAGFMSFWAGARLKMIWDRLDSTIVQAHNGYLEQYLNLGWIGVIFIGAIILSGLLNVRRHLSIDYSSAMLRLSFIAVVVVSNYTEASFYGINNLWLLLLLGVIEIPGQSTVKDATVPMSGEVLYCGHVSETK